MTRKSSFSYMLLALAAWAVSIGMGVRTAMAFPAFGTIAYGECFACHTTIVEDRAALLNADGLFDPTEREGEPDRGALPYYTVRPGGQISMLIEMVDGTEDYAYQFIGTDRPDVTNGGILAFTEDPEWYRYEDPEAPLYYCQSDNPYNGYDWPSGDPRVVSFNLGVNAATPEGAYLLTLATAGRDTVRDGWYQEFNFYLVVTNASTRLSLTATDIVRGQQATLTAMNGAANQMVYFVYSTSGYGSTNVAPLGVTLDIKNPILLGQARANNNGTAEFRKTVPATAPPVAVYLQAAQAGRKSNAIQSQIE